MNYNIARRIGLLTTIFGYAGVASAYSVLHTQGKVVRWPTNTLNYEINQSAAPDADISDGSDIVAVQAAADSWNAVECSALDLVETQLTTQSSTSILTNKLDGINRFAWHDEWTLPSYVLAVTYPAYARATGKLVESDIGFNGTVRWTTKKGVKGAYDIQAVATHELGHAFGLRHVPDGNSWTEKPTMAPEYHADGYKLTEDDKNGLCFLYPQQPYSCAAALECPQVNTLSDQDEILVGQSACVAGACQNMVVPLVSDKRGQRCVEDSVCGKGLGCYEGVCTSGCDVDFVNCPADYTCAAAEKGGACFPNELLQSRSRNASVSGGTNGNIDGFKTDRDAAQHGEESSFGCQAGPDFPIHFVLALLVSVWVRHKRRVVGVRVVS